MADQKISALSPAGAPQTGDLYVIARGGANYNQTQEQASGGLLFCDAPNADFDLTNGGAGGAVTIISKSITGIAVGDQIQLEIWYTILNNSGSARTYTDTGSLGSVSIGGAHAGLNASATSRGPRFARFSFSISASNLAYAMKWSAAGGSVADGLNAGYAHVGGWSASSSDLTGTQTLTFTIASNNTTATQTLTLHNYTIRKIPTK